MESKYVAYHFKVEPKNPGADILLAELAELPLIVLWKPKQVYRLIFRHMTELKIFLMKSTFKLNPNLKYHKKLKK